MRVKIRAVSLIPFLIFSIATSSYGQPLSIQQAQDSLSSLKERLKKERGRGEYETTKEYKRRIKKLKRSIDKEIDNLLSKTYTDTVDIRFGRYKANKRALPVIVEQSSYGGGKISSSFNIGYNFVLNVDPNTAKRLKETITSEEITAYGDFWIERSSRFYAEGGLTLKARGSTYQTSKNEIRLQITDSKEISAVPPKQVMEYLSPRRTEISPNGRYIGTKRYLIDVKSSKTLLTFENECKEIRYSLDSKYFACITNEQPRKIVLYNLKNRKIEVRNKTVKCGYGKPSKNFGIYTQVKPAKKIVKRLEAPYGKREAKDAIIEKTLMMSKDSSIVVGLSYHGKEELEKRYTVFWSARTGEMVRQPISKMTPIGFLPDGRLAIGRDVDMQNAQTPFRERGLKVSTTIKLLDINKRGEWTKKSIPTRYTKKYTKKSIKRFDKKVNKVVTKTRNKIDKGNLDGTCSFKMVHQIKNGGNNKITRIVHFPYKYYVKTNTIKIVGNSKKMVAINLKTGRAKSIKGKKRKKRIGTFWIRPTYLFSNLDNKELNIELIKSSSFVKIIKVEPPFGREFKMFIPSKSNLPSKVVFKKNAPLGMKYKVEVMFNKYVEKDGILIPSLIVQKPKIGDKKRSILLDFEADIKTADVFSPPYR